MSIAFRDLPVYDLLGATRNFEQLTSASFPPEGKAGGALAGEYPNPTLKAPEAFKGAEALGFKNSWKNFEAARKAEYRKNQLGIVELRGIIASGESGKGAFTLPAGYRPIGAKGFIVVASSNTGLLSVETNGEVVPTNLGGEVKGTTNLDPVFFSVE